MKSGDAKGAILSLTSVLSSFFISSVMVTPSFGVTKQYRHSPFTAWGAATTAASATLGCSTITDSTWAVDIKWPGKKLLLK